MLNLLNKRCIIRAISNPSRSLAVNDLKNPNIDKKPVVTMLPCGLNSFLVFPVRESPQGSMVTDYC